jgi:hypothetical protein
MVMAKNLCGFQDRLSQNASRRDDKARHFFAALFFV